MDQALAEQIETILKNADDMTIATVRADGFPQATTVSFVSDGHTIYFGCGANSQKAANLARSDKVSITVNLPYDDWSEIRGLSIGALATRVTDPDDMAKIGALMKAKFPLIGEYAPQDPSDVALYRVTPKVVSVLDYSRGFGHTDLVRL
jgi:general stress protein 26